MKKIALFIATALCVATTYAQNSLNLQKGQKYLVENKMIKNYSSEVQGQRMETNIDISTTYNIDVSDVTATNINLTNTVSRMVMSMNMMGRDLKFDSDKKEELDGQMGSSFKDYIKKPVAVSLEKSGKLVLEKKDASKELSSIAKQFIDFEAQGYGSELAFQSLPANLKVGSAWSVESNTTTNKKATNYTVKSIAGDLATITFDGTSNSEEEMEQQGMQITIKKNGKFTGTEVVNIKTGVVESNTTNTTTTITEENTETMGEEMITSSETTSTTSVKAI